MTSNLTRDEAWERAGCSAGRIPRPGRARSRQVPITNGSSTPIEADELIARTVPRRAPPPAVEARDEKARAIRCQERDRQAG